MTKVNGKEPQAAPKPQADPHLLEGISQLYHDYQAGELVGMSIIAIDQHGNIFKHMGTNGVPMLDALMLSHLQRQGLSLMAGIQEREDIARSQQMLERQKQAELAKNKAPANDAETAPPPEDA